jgi:hypothetical protein
MHSRHPRSLILHPGTGPPVSGHTGIALHFRTFSPHSLQNRFRFHLSIACFSGLHVQGWMSPFTVSPHSGQWRTDGLERTWLRFEHRLPCMVSSPSCGGPGFRTSPHSRLGGNPWGMEWSRSNPRACTGGASRGDRPHHVLPFLPLALERGRDGTSAGHGRPSGWQRSFLLCLSRRTLMGWEEIPSLVLVLFR